ncbi:MAG TPA: DUF2127 domain-containing protein [Solirubrobacteraceae bacterium]|nr:DUF2127 domain-containing protein [Solirubrobacteraceae bacterium]
MRPPPGTHPQPRPRRRVDWELISCGLSGHALVGADAARLRPGDALFAREADGLRWYRCLRCDSWVALHEPAAPSREFPPAREEIVIPLRGRALRDRFVLRLIAVDRALHFIVLGLLGLAVLAFAAHERSLRGTFYRVLADIQRGLGGGPVQKSGHVGIVGELDKLFSLQSGRLHELAAVLIAYAVLEGVEAVGLWFMRRWAEYLTFVATTILLPLEIYEIMHRATVLKVIGFIINLAVVVYLLLAKRLFGLRGGGTAEAHERARDMTWEALEQATPPYALERAT